MEGGTLETKAQGALGTGTVTLDGGTLSIEAVDQTHGQVFSVSSASTVNVGTGRTFTLGNGDNDLTGTGTNWDSDLDPPSGASLAMSGALRLTNNIEGAGVTNVTLQHMVCFFPRHTISCGFRFRNRNPGMI
jgi:hypothetical protein